LFPPQEESQRVQDTLGPVTFRGGTASKARKATRSLATGARSAFDGVLMRGEVLCAEERRKRRFLSGCATSSMDLMHNDGFDKTGSATNARKANKTACVFVFCKT
jgi:hypothetical protein